MLIGKIATSFASSNQNRFHSLVVVVLSSPLLLLLRAFHQTFYNLSTSIAISGDASKMPTLVYSGKYF
jgi:hypothetical protein